jgi:transcriptional regulator with XRE-family HTH domain
MTQQDKPTAPSATTQARQSNIATEPDTFGRRLRLARQTMGLSQARLAQMLARDQSAVSQWEIGHREPNLLTLEQLANVLDVSLDWLVRGVSP